MTLRERQPGSERLGKTEDDDERRRLSAFHLIGLAAGGMIGSGWLMGAANAYREASSLAYVAWFLCGLVMLVIAGVMVELGTAAPKTGGLIFLPLQSSGALVATLVAADLWIVYALNLASEAAAMTQGLSWKFDELVDGSGESVTLKGWGLGCAVAFMMAISAVNLVAPWLFMRINSGLTVAKVVILVLTIWLLISWGLHDHASAAHRAHRFGKDLDAVMAAVTDGGMIFAYVGFQGPLDFAGNIKRRGIGEAARLRWAVFGTLIGSMILYILLQIVFDGHRTHGNPLSPDSPYVQFAIAAGMVGLVWLLRVGSVLSPMSAGLVFAHTLTREVAALSRAHLTHRGLQTARKSSLRRRYDVYWLVLLVDLVVAVIALVALRGNWHTLVAINEVLTLVIYAIPSVVLVSLRDHLPGSPLRRKVRGILARTSFVLITLILCMAERSRLLQGMAALAIGSLLLLWLPVVARWLPAFGRIYDAKEHVKHFRNWRTNPAAGAAVCLIGYLAVLVPLNLLSQSSVAYGKLLAAILAVAMAFGAFEGLVSASKRHMAEVRPLLPTPAVAAPVPAANAASG
jgi:amino acid transporter